MCIVSACNVGVGGCFKKFCFGGGGVCEWQTDRNGERERHEKYWEIFPIYRKLGFDKHLTVCCQIQLTALWKYLYCFKHSFICVSFLHMASQRCTSFKNVLHTLLQHQAVNMDVFLLNYCNYTHCMLCFSLLLFTYRTQVSTSIAYTAGITSQRHADILKPCL